MAIQKITIENYDDIYPYSCARKEILQYWHDQAWLIKRPYFYEIKDNVLYVFKNVYFQKYVFLAMPPMTMECDYEKEYELMLNSEYDCVYSSEWIKNIETPIESVIEKDKIEWIYNPKTYNSLQGKKFGNWRNAINYLNKNGYKFEFLEYDNNDIFQSNYILNVLVPEFDKISNEWEVIKNKKASDKYIWTSLLSHLKNVRIMTLKDQNNRIISYNISQLLGNTVIYSYEKSRENAHNSQMKAIHYNFCHYWEKEVNENIYLNRGCDVNDPGLKNNKRELKPIKEMQLYKLRINKGNSFGDKTLLVNKDLLYPSEKIDLYKRRTNE